MATTKTNYWYECPNCGFEVLAKTKKELDKLSVHNCAEYIGEQNGKI